MRGAVTDEEMAVLYALVRDRLKGRSPLIKFLAIKGSVIVLPDSVNHR